MSLQSQLNLQDSTQDHQDLNLEDHHLKRIPKSLRLLSLKLLLSPKLVLLKRKMQKLKLPLTKLQQKVKSPKQKLKRRVRKRHQLKLKKQLQNQSQRLRLLLSHKLKLMLLQKKRPKFKHLLVKLQVPQVSSVLHQNLNWFHGLMVNLKMMMP